MMTKKRALINVNLFRPRYAIAGGQPIRNGEAYNRREMECTWTPVGPVGVVEESAFRKLSDRSWETSVRRCEVWFTNQQTGIRESITYCLLAEKSERSVVAEKWGNAHGAKGPYFSHANTKRRRSA